MADDLPPSAVTSSREVATHLLDARSATFTVTRVS